MEQKIGEQFEYNGVRLKVVESKACKGCYFFKDFRYCDEIIEVTGDCIPLYRSDRKSVNFQKVE